MIYFRFDLPLKTKTLFRERERGSKKTAATFIFPLRAG
jgi:hypothetical protein